MQDTEAKAAAMEAALDGYGQHGCGEVVVLGDAEAATEAEVETTEAEAEGGRWQRQHAEVEGKAAIGDQNRIFDPGGGV